MLAHNQSTDAKKSNGALHYKYIGDPNIEQDKFNESNYVLNKLPNLIIVAANGPDGVLHGRSNYGESVDITGPSAVYSASCLTDLNQSTYNIAKTTQWYGYDFEDFNYSNFTDVSGADEDSPDFYKSCTVNGFANGTSASQPIVAGSAALLLSRNINLNPFEIKGYLTQTPNLIKTSLRYSTDVNSFQGYGNLCPEMPYLGNCTLKIPILNIEKSMKQYEVEHIVGSFLEDFIGISDRLKTSKYPMKIVSSYVPFNVANFYGNVNFYNVSYYGINAVNLSEIPVKSLKSEVKQNTSFLTINQNGSNTCPIVSGKKVCTYNVNFTYKTDVNAHVRVINQYAGTELANFNLVKGTENNLSITFSSYSTNIDFRVVSVGTGNLYTGNISINGKVIDLAKMTIHKVNSYVSDNNIAYSMSGSGNFYTLKPNVNYNFFPNEYIGITLIASSGNFELNTPFNTKQLKFSYTAFESRTGINPYFKIYDENNNLLYSNTTLPAFRTVEQVVVNIPLGTKKLRFSGDLHILYVDKFEFTS